MPVIENNPEKKWFREFDELGEKRVRELLLSPSLDEDKRRVARRWIEKQDVKRWQAKQAASGGGTPAFKRWLQDYRSWWMLLVSFGFLLLGLSRFRW